MSANDAERSDLEARMQQHRERIDAIDHEILGLINERAREAQAIGHLKTRGDAEFYIPSREKAILNRLRGANQGPLSYDAIASVFQEVISACRSLETLISIAYLGPDGTYHHAAAQKQFGRSAQFLPVKTISQVFEMVERNRADYGVVAIENSIEGSVGETLDRVAHSNVKVVGERYLPISHNLISRSKLDAIDKVYSHPQGLAQCRKWLETNLPGVQPIDSSSTSRAVQFCQDDPKAAAIASELASELFEVPIQVRGIEDIAGNTTRFYIIAKKPLNPSGDDKTSMAVYVRDQVGALYTMLEPFKKNHVNLTNIVSRPSKQEAWQYMFFVECQGHHQDDNVKAAIEEIESNSLYIKILGSYPRAQRPQQEDYL
ncbi:MAG: prephenate dehydratase [bacterium]|nr:prephenate dehydratase [bacterium]